MTDVEFFEKVKQLVSDQTNKHMDVTDKTKITPKDVYLVWYAQKLYRIGKLLQAQIFQMVCIMN